MSETPDLSTDEDPLASSGSELLVPILRVDDEQLDQAELATWHEALSDTVAVEVPHDLLGLWLYPSHGGAVLLGPAELAEDDLAVPLPSPHLKPEELSQLEQVVSQAGYGSVACLPVTFGKRDVALLLMADLRAGLYGSVERVVLQCVTQRIAPMLGRIARQWKAAEGSPSRQQERIAGLLETIAEANRSSATPQRFLAAVSRGLAPLLPHEHIELLLSDPAGKRYFRLGEHPGGPLWQDPSLIISRDHLDVGGIFGLGNSLLVGDTYGDSRWPRGFLTASEPAGADTRALVGARLDLRANVPAYLLVGSIGPAFYADEDAELLALLGWIDRPPDQRVSGYRGSSAAGSQAGRNTPSCRAALSDSWSAGHHLRSGSGDGADSLRVARRVALRQAYLCASDDPDGPGDHAGAGGEADSFTSSARLGRRHFSGPDAQGRSALWLRSERERDPADRSAQGGGSSARSPDLQLRVARHAQRASRAHCPASGRHHRGALRTASPRRNAAASHRVALALRPKDRDLRPSVS